MTEIPDTQHDEDPADAAPVEEFHSDDIAPREGPNFHLTVGSRKLTTWKPKDVFWEAAVLAFDANEKALDAERQLNAADAYLLNAHTKRKLREWVDAAPGIAKFRETFIEFVFMCLSDEDEAYARQSWLSKHGALTSGKLYMHGVWLMHKYTPVFSEELKQLPVEFADRIGQLDDDEEPEGNRAARRAAARR